MLPITWVPFWIKSVFFTVNSFLGTFFHSSVNLVLYDIFCIIFIFSGTLDRAPVYASYTVGSCAQIGASKVIEFVETVGMNGCFEKFIQRVLNTPLQIKLSRAVWHSSTPALIRTHDSVFRYVKCALMRWNLRWLTVIIFYINIFTWLNNALRFYVTLNSI